MKKAILIGTVMIGLSLLLASVCQAQLREQQTKRSEYSGPIIKKENPSEGANLGNLFNMQMSHNYSVNFGSFGGQVMNMNAYTNSMQFFFSEDLTGQVDISLLHSPFGQGNLYDFRNDNKVQVMFNAQLDYQINERMNLHLEVNQYPNGYGFHPGYGMYRNSFLQSRPLEY